MISPELPTRLRRIARGYEPTDLGVADNMDEAAAEIDRLTEEVARLTAVLAAAVARMETAGPDYDYDDVIAQGREALKETT